MEASVVGDEAMVGIVVGAAVDTTGASVGAAVMVGSAVAFVGSTNFTGEKTLD
jgi:hypothetical protein